MTTDSFKDTFHIKGQLTQGHLLYDSRKTVIVKDKRLHTTDIVEQLRERMTKRNIDGQQGSSF